MGYPSHEDAPVRRRGHAARSSVQRLEMRRSPCSFHSSHPTRTELEALARVAVVASQTDELRSPATVIPAVCGVTSGTGLLDPRPGH